MKAKVIIFLVMFASGCVTTNNNKFDEGAVVSSLDKAWKNYWAKNKDRSWSKDFDCKKIKKVRQDCLLKTPPR